ncbi:MAG: DUF1003 domain-containing protein [Bacteroidales bacterium]
MKSFVSDISGKEFPLPERVSGKSIRANLLATIQKEYPQFSPDNFLSLHELNGFREKYITETLVNEVGDLSQFEEKVLQSLRDKSTIADKLDGDDKPLTLGQRVADKVATFGGSWIFIISFGFFIFIWIGINIFWLANRAFDPYPFILLNLILSCLAAIQAPVIMMSQNRQEEKDRERSRNDYMINLKSEIEIRTLHEKVDHFMLHQMQEVVEIQRIQIEMINDLQRQIGKS